jgi:hypothetical protein
MVRILEIGRGSYSYPIIVDLSLFSYRLHMTRNIVAEKYWLIEFFTMDIKLQNKTIHEPVRHQNMVIDEHSPTYQNTTQSHKMCHHNA